ncbi:MAG: metallophosphoesterase [Phycisphaerales bacterium]
MQQDATMVKTLHTRRSMLQAAGMLALTGCATARAKGREASAVFTQRPAGRVVRLAHMTDVHVEPERKAPEGMAAALAHVHGQADRPDMILTGGDLVMDSFGASDARAQTQWDVFTRVLKENTRIPVRHCMGNHDIWGWNKKDSGCSGNEPLWGKKRFCDVLGVESPHYSFMQGNWKIIVLDSVQPDGGSGYLGGLDDAQFEWLTGELGGMKAGEYALLVSHIPIINISTVLADTQPVKDRWELSGGLMFLDARRVVSLLANCPQAKAAISGHIHTQEDVMFQGVRYLNNGAVSGNWWKSQEKAKADRHAAGVHVKNWNPLRSDPGYAIVDLFDDGRVACEYVTYGWQGE